jgi:hypothetical protein
MRTFVGWHGCSPNCRIEKGGEKAAAFELSSAFLLPIMMSFFTSLLSGVGIPVSKIDFMLSNDASANLSAQTCNPITGKGIQR